MVRLNSAEVICNRLINQTFNKRQPGISRPIPTSASTPNCLSRKDIGDAGFATDTNFPAPYPERFAQEALGHNSKAAHRAYAKRALMKIPSLEDYEQRAA
jgi:hypothetical protein